MSDKIYPIGIQNFEKLRKEAFPCFTEQTPHDKGL